MDSRQFYALKIHILLCGVYWSYLIISSLIPPPIKKPIILLYSLVLKVGGGGVMYIATKYNTITYYNKDVHELVRVRDSAPRGAVILSE